ncbi:hypothetical protein [Amycolatopsis thermoflava]|uniref:hypothetical protein n=1 Tax=Amycolatopsis thermoflava TaxID=84480 RepID=UPI00380DD9E9
MVGGLVVVVGRAVVVAPGGSVVPGDVVVERDGEVGGAVTRVTSTRHVWSSGEHSTEPVTLQALSTATVAATAATRAQVLIFIR